MNMKLIREGEALWHLSVGDKDLWLSVSQLEELRGFLNDMNI